MLQVNDRCVHPSHGAGVILAIYQDDSAYVRFDKEIPSWFTGNTDNEIRLTYSLLKAEEVAGCGTQSNTP